MKFQNKQANYTKEPVPSNKFSALRIILVILLITNLISFIVWQNIKGLDLDNQIKKLERDQLELYHIYNQRLIEYEKMKQSSNIKQYAKNHLGMIPSKKEDFVFLGIKNKEKLIQKMMVKENKQ